MTAVSEVVVGRGAPVGWMQRASGKGLDIATPDHKAIDFNDMATALSLICRFNGAMLSPRKFYSVAQHSIVVSWLVPERYRLYGLLHDGHEYILGDDSTPKKNVIAALSPEFAEKYRDLKNRWDTAIWEAAGVAVPDAEAKAHVREADHLAMAVERRDLLAEPRDETTRKAWSWLPKPPAGITIGTPLLSAKACEAFLWQLRDCVWPGQRPGWA